MPKLHDLTDAYSEYLRTMADAAEHPADRIALVGAANLIDQMAEYVYGPTGRRLAKPGEIPATPAGKLLQDLDLKPGDVVRCVKSAVSWLVVGNDYMMGVRRRYDDDDAWFSQFSSSLFTIVSRAADLPEWARQALREREAGNE